MHRGNKVNKVTHTFACHLGVKRKGYLISIFEGQGSDITYVMKSDDGKTFYVSGSELKSIKRISEGQ